MATKKPKASLAETLGVASPEDLAAKEAAAKKVVQEQNAKNPMKQGVSDVAGRLEKSAPETIPAASPAGALSPGGAQVVAALVAQGFSYDQAVSMLSGGSGGTGPAPAPATVASTLTAEERAHIKKLSEGDDSDLPEVEDVVDKFAIVEVDQEKRAGFKTLLDDYWTRREELEDVPKKTRYRVTFDIEAPEWDWLLHRTISEGQARRDAEYTVQRALMLLLKQQKALDHTRGGKRAYGGSGPKEAYNPTTGGWGNKT